MRETRGEKEDAKEINMRVGDEYETGNKKKEMAQGTKNRKKEERNKKGTEQKRGRKLELTNKMKDAGKKKRINNKKEKQRTERSKTEKIYKEIKSGRTKEKWKFQMK
jgi:hypothetical protein